MFRRLFALFCALTVVGALSWGATAAPISGSFGIDIVLYPQGPVIDKLDLIDMKFEADLILTFSVSGVDITSTSVFTFRGVEFQSFVISATLGALTIKDTIIFSPTMLEFEELRAQAGAVFWALMLAVPTAGFPAIPALGLTSITDPLGPVIGFGTMSWAGLLADHPVVQNLILARWFDDPDANVNTPSPLANPLVFRKKIAELSLNIAGMTLGVRALFANTATSTTGFSMQSGLVLTMEGATVSGVLVRGELWLGAKQGFECFGECKPIERFFNAMVTGGGMANTEEEKLFLSNVVIAGVRHDLRAEMHFQVGDGLRDGTGLDPQCSIDQVDSDNDGFIGETGDAINIVSPICFVQLTQSGVIRPWGLSFRQIWRFNGVFDLVGYVTTLTLRVGDMATTATFIWAESIGRSFEPYLADLVSTFDPPGVTVTSVIRLCVESGGGICTVPVSFHSLSFSGVVGPLSVSASALFINGILGDFNRLTVDLSFTVGAMTVVSSTILLQDVLGGQAFSFTVKF